jgi:hypothetical protein
VDNSENGVKNNVVLLSLTTPMQCNSSMLSTNANPKVQIARISFGLLETVFQEIHYWKPTSTTASYFE